jgi:hypothetical protein
MMLAVQWLMMAVMWYDVGVMQVLMMAMIKYYIVQNMGVDDDQVWFDVGVTRV